MKFKRKWNNGQAMAAVPGKSFCLAPNEKKNDNGSCCKNIFFLNFKECNMENIENFHVCIKCSQNMPTFWFTSTNYPKPNIFKNIYLSKK